MGRCSRVQSSRCFTIVHAVGPSRCGRYQPQREGEARLVRRNLVVCRRKAEERPEHEEALDGAGDVWTWTALDSDSKLIISWLIDGRDGEYALAFMDDVKDVQLTTDRHKTYLEGVERAFGADIDYAMLGEDVGEPEGKPVPVERRYSPAACTGAK